MSSARNKWTAIVPFKGRAERKTRLAELFSREQRIRLSQRMFDHVRDQLGACAAIEEVGLLSDIPVPGWNGLYFHDEGRGLNEELAAFASRRTHSPLLIIHADLPLLNSPDISALLHEADNAGIAVAPDRNDSGSNALALLDPAGFHFQFGPDSLDRHVRASGGHAVLVRRAGLAYDIDTPDDYRAASDIAPDIMERLMA